MRNYTAKLALLLLIIFAIAMGLFGFLIVHDNNRISAQSRQLQAFVHQRAAISNKRNATTQKVLRNQCSELDEFKKALRPLVVSSIEQTKKIHIPGFTESERRASLRLARRELKILQPSAKCAKINIVHPDPGPNR